MIAFLARVSGGAVNSEFEFLDKRKLTYLFLHPPPYPHTHPVKTVKIVVLGLVEHRIKLRCILGAFIVPLTFNLVNEFVFSKSIFH